MYKISIHILPLTLVFLVVASTEAQVNSNNKPVVAATQPPAPTAAIVAAPAAYATSTTVNFVRSWEAMGPITTTTGFTTQPYTAVKQTTSYIDGLGRPLQTVMRQVTPNAMDLVSPVIY